MCLVLQPDLPPGLIANVIAGDSAPVDRPLDPNIRTFLRGMEEIERLNLMSTETAAEILGSYTQVPAIRDSTLPPLEK